MMNKEVQSKFDNYPSYVKNKMLELRALILDVIKTNDFEVYEETLKWGEPSYLVKGGSTVRIDWKSKSEDKYFIFFNCKTKLVSTFRILYKDLLIFEGDRAIVLNINEPLPLDIIKHCVELSLKYKSIKHLPLLGE